MNKRIIAILLAGAVFGSQFTVAAHTVNASATSDDAIEVNSKSDEEDKEKDRLEIAGGGEVRNTAGVEAILEGNGRVVKKEPVSGNPSSHEVIQSDKYNTITSLDVGSRVTKVEDNLFSGMSNLTELVFTTASQLTTIGKSAFQGTGIKEVTLPASLVTIDTSAFKGTQALTSVDFSNASKLVNIEESAFERSGIGSVVLPPALKTIGGSAFKGIPSLKTADFSKSTKIAYIGESAFEGSGLTGSVALAGLMPAGQAQVKIEDKAFMNNKGITSVTLPPSMNTLNAHVFAGTSITTIEANRDCAVMTASALPQTLTSITVAQGNTNLAVDNGGLYNARKTTLWVYPGGKTGEVQFSDAITVIGGYAFENNPTITKVTIPESVADISVAAFKGSSKLEEVNLGHSPQLKDIEAGAFANTTSLKKLDLSKATKLGSIKSTAFKNGALRVLQIGKNTNMFSITSSTFEGTPTNKKVHLVDDNGDLLKGQEFSDLKVKWNKLTEVSNGSWAFYERYPTPNASVDYTTMKIKGLEASAVYKVAGATATPEVLTADEKGEIGLKKAWGGKTIQISRQATEDNGESDPKDIQVQTLYAVTVDGEEYAVGVEGASIKVVAPAKDGHTFKEWKAEGVTLTEPSKREITVTILKADVKLTTSYTLVVTTKPEELEFDGSKDIGIEFLFPIAEFKDLIIDGKTLVRDTEYTVAEGGVAVATLASGKTVVTLKKAYLDTLKGGTNSFQAVFDKGLVDFSIKVVKEPADKPEDKPQDKPEDKPAVVFPDVKGDDWFFNPVNYVSSRGLMTGYNNGTFGPSDILGRGQFATILYRIGGSPATEYKDVFSDVQGSQFYSLPVVWAKENGIITGYEGNVFGPSESITREQLVTIMYRYAAKLGADVSAKGDIGTFPDAGNVSSFSKDALGWAVGSGIISGDQGKINPQGTSSRAVAATVIQRFHEKYQSK